MTAIDKIILSEIYADLEENQDLASGEEVTADVQAPAEDEGQNPEKNGVMSVLASVKELQIQNLIPAA